MSRNFHLPWHEYVETLQPHERPMLPGSPATPDHAASRRLAYAFTGLLVTMTAGLGNAFITVNVPQLGGALGVTTAEAAWLPVVFVMTNACMNLILIKFRMQYGLQLFTKIFLTAYVVVALANVFAHDYGTVLAVRAIGGMAAAGMTSLGFLYLIQAFPAAHRLKGLIIGIGLSSFAVPVARLFSGDLLELSDWRGFHLMELGLALLSLAAVFTLRLPPSERLKVFDRLDFLTFALFAPGIALLCAVLGLGRIVWWTEAPWIGWALIGAIMLLTAAVLVEANRRTPLINLNWLAGGDVVRLVLAIMLLRVVLSEQTSGAVGFLQQMGLGSDQLRGLFAVVLAGMVAGTLTSAFTLNMQKLNKPIAIALALIAMGAFMDSHATSLTRPGNLYFSQALMAFASAFFIGPALMIGISNVLQKGAQNLVTFIVVFSVCQNVGGLAGSALVGSVETILQRRHFNRLAENLSLADPDVVQRLQQLSGAYARVIADPAQRSVEGLRLLQQQAAQQAHVLAYNDVFLMIAVAAALGSAWVTVHHIRSRVRARAADAHAAAATAAAAAD